MTFAVTLEVVLPGKRLVAKRALEGPRPTVEGQVVFEVIGMQKPSRAVGAGVRALACVFPHVDLQLIIADENRAEDKTMKR